MPAINYIGDETFPPFTLTFRQFIHKETGNKMWERGPARFFDTVTGEAIHQFYDNYMDTLTYDQKITIDFPEGSFPVVSVEGSAD